MERYKSRKEAGFFIHNQKNPNAVNNAGTYLHQCHPTAVSLPDLRTRWCSCRYEFGPISGKPNGMAQGARAGPCMAPSIMPAAAVPGDPTPHSGSDLGLVGLQSQGLCCCCGWEGDPGRSQPGFEAMPESILSPSSPVTSAAAALGGRCCGGKRRNGFL